MRRLAATSDDGISLALAVRAFVADVLLDMNMEDRTYLGIARSDSHEPTTSN